jgi:hypothetical protein
VVSDDVIESPGDAPKKKPSQFVAENTVGKEPVKDPKPALAALAIPPEAAAPKKPQRAERTDIRATARPMPVREKIARAQGRGFHW